METRQSTKQETGKETKRGDMETNFEVQQRTYRDQARTFFSDADRYERLKKIAVLGEKIYSIIFFFVKEFDKGRIVATRHGGYYRICDEYRNAITNHKKRYYDFESREGKGVLKWQGITNPRVLVNADMGSIALSLPRIVAIQWFIQYDFDLLFWEQYDNVYARYIAFTTSVKRRYTEAHKQKKREDRLRLEKEIIRSRRCEPPGKGKKSVYLTRTERQMVSSMMKSRRKKRADKKKTNNSEAKPTEDEPHGLQVLQGPVVV